MVLSRDEVRGVLLNKERLISKDGESSVPDVWKNPKPPIDTSKIDMISDALRAKLFTRIGEQEPLKALKSIFEPPPLPSSTSSSTTSSASESSPLSPTLSSSPPNTRVDADTFTRMCASKLNFIGYEEEVRALFKRMDVDRQGQVELMTIYSILNKDSSSRATTAIGKVREILMKRSGGISSLKTLGLQFKLLDSDRGGTLSKKELDEGLSKFMRGFKVLLSSQEIDALFKYFDVDGSNSVTYDEFLRGIRGDMNEYRQSFVRKAFDILDGNKDGRLSLEEIASKYNVADNPMVKSGKITEIDALKAFIAHWHMDDKSAHDSVTLAEFINYYQWVSASIDDDQYFELMMRNAWHMSGGKGVCENTTNLRVLVTHNDGRQTVEEIKDDFDLKRDDVQAIKARLRAQGINAKEISLRD